MTELAGQSQFRCNGSDGYLAWIDDTLGMRPTANTTLDTGDYEFRVFDDPAAMHALIEQKNRASNRLRVVTGKDGGGSQSQTYAALRGSEAVTILGSHHELSKAGHLDELTDSRKFERR